MCRKYIALVLLVILGLLPLYGVSDNVSNSLILQLKPLASERLEKVVQEKSFYNSVLGTLRFAGLLVSPMSGFDITGTVPSSEMITMFGILAGPYIMYSWLYSDPAENDLSTIYKMYSTERINKIDKELLAEKALEKAAGYDHFNRMVWGTVRVGFGSLVALVEGSNSKPPIAGAIITGWGIYSLLNPTSAENNYDQYNQDKSKLTSSLGLYNGAPALQLSLKY